MRRFPRTALVLVEGPYDPDGYETARAHAKAAALYGVPFVRFGSTLTTIDDEKVWPTIDHKAHPGDNVHALIAEALVIWLNQTTKPRHLAAPDLACLRFPPTADAALAARFKVCDKPATLFDTGSHKGDSYGVDSAAVRWRVVFVSTRNCSIVVLAQDDMENVLPRNNRCRVRCSAILTFSNLSHPCVAQVRRQAGLRPPFNNRKAQSRQRQLVPDRGPRGQARVDQ